MMGNKNIKLPISGETEPENVSPDPFSGWFDNSFTVESFKCGLELLQEAADKNLPADLLVDSGVSGASAANWERYKRSVHGIFAADDDKLGFFKNIQYQKEPSLIQDSASITITIQNNSRLSGYVSMALSLAFLIAEDITATTDDNGDIQICFTVSGIHAAPIESEQT